MSKLPHKSQHVHSMLGTITSRCAESKRASSEAATYTCPGSPPAISVQHAGQQPSAAAECSAWPSSRGFQTQTQRSLCLGLDAAECHCLLIPTDIN